ncbi:DUF4258 domain-containing protein [Kitasatospora sp. NBC_01266]|uniref:DUF4258 domain-containing protein n=1 Tax=Kitasatospora sp. NBC_01266 TaxID=2903572 RepID=UPI002E33A6E0|nr:DUF4258 domain-containing protein [Kitasatospora sp. NBC_01266]
MLLAPLATVLALSATPALAATPAPAASPVSVAPAATDGWGLPNPPRVNNCGDDGAPGAIDVLSQHVQDRMNERDITRDELDKAIRIGARTAQCVNGNWRYTLGMDGGWLTVVVGLGNGGWVAITAWWN